MLPSIMTLHVAKKDGSAVLGTGFMAIKDGMAVTARHVVKDAVRVSAHFSDGEDFDASGLVDKDEKRDLALIKIKVAGRALLSLSPSLPDIGSKAFVISAPKGLEFSISDGLVTDVTQSRRERQVWGARTPTARWAEEAHAWMKRTRG